jgi:DNA-binding transcriptional regulator YiaG
LERQRHTSNGLISYAQGLDAVRLRQRRRRNCRRRDAVRCLFMPDIASALKSEIARLARKEVRAEADSLKKASSQHRAHIAALRKKTDELERALKRASRGTATKREDAGDGDRNLRFRAEGFAAHRKRLGLSAREMGLLLDASSLSVYKWESGQSRPRAKHLQAIAAVRRMGKREASKRLQELGENS